MYRYIHYVNLFIIFDNRESVLAGISADTPYKDIKPTFIHLLFDFIRERKDNYNGAFIVYIMKHSVTDTKEDNNSQNNEGYFLE